MKYAVSKAPASSPCDPCLSTSTNLPAGKRRLSSSVTTAFAACRWWTGCAGKASAIARAWPVESTSGAFRSTPPFPVTEPFLSRPVDLLPGEHPCQYRKPEGEKRHEGGLEPVDHAADEPVVFADEDRGSRRAVAFEHALRHGRRQPFMNRSHRTQDNDLLGRAPHLRAHLNAAAIRAIAFIHLPERP